MISVCILKNNSAGIVCTHLYIFYTHYDGNKNLDALCCRTLPEKSWCTIYYSELFLVKDLLFCFAYNCKNTVKFNNHIAFFPFLSFT